MLYGDSARPWSKPFPFLGQNPPLNIEFVLLQHPGKCPELPEFLQDFRVGLGAALKDQGVQNGDSGGLQEWQ